MLLRTGIGFDVHGFAENRPLVLGGVNIPYERGLAGHSDADVLLHAIMDAMLGALALGDIGRHFPDTSPEWKGISSVVLLKKVQTLINNEGYQLNNLDAVVIAQEPRLSPHIPTMRQKIADTLWCDLERISIKATTTEYLGFTGRKEGIAALAIVTLSKKER